MINDLQTLAPLRLESVRETLCSNGLYLEWDDALGYGYLPSNGCEYDAAYWDKYVAMENTELGHALTHARYDFVVDYLNEDNFTGIDIGIGSGAFVKHSAFFGYDINPYAIEWLKATKSWTDPYAVPLADHVTPPVVLTMWDVLEHIDDPKPLLDIATYVFTSLPIHADMEACLRSKHLRPNEHIWHFTQHGISNFMKGHGFELVATDDHETQLGREDILSFCFKRV